MAGKACVFRRKPKGRLKIGREPRARGRRCILVHMKEQKTNRSAQKTLPERSDTFAPSAQASTGRRAASGFKGTFRGVILYDPNFVRRNEWRLVAGGGAASHAAGHVASAPPALRGRASGFQHLPKVLAGPSAKKIQPGLKADSAFGMSGVLTILPGRGRGRISVPIPQSVPISKVQINAHLPSRRSTRRLCHLADVKWKERLIQHL